MSRLHRNRVDGASIRRRKRIKEIVKKIRFMQFEKDVNDIWSKELQGAEPVFSANETIIQPSKQFEQFNNGDIMEICSSHLPYKEDYGQDTKED